MNEYHVRTLVIYNSSPEESQVLIGQIALNTLSISYQDGMYLSNALRAGKNVTLDLINRPQAGVGVPNKLVPGELEATTMWGPDYYMNLWPTIVAPGDPLLAITTVFGEVWNGNSPVYGIYGGTYLSNAYVAGAAALYYGSHGGRAKMGKTAAKDALSKMITSGVPIEWNPHTQFTIKPQAKRDK
jgi:hypothetical protein